MMVNPSRASEILAEMHIPHQVFRHASQVSSLEQAAEERNQRPSQIVRTLLFRVAKNNFILILITGTQQVSWRKLRQYLGQSRLTMARRDEVVAVTGYQIGAVSPFGLPQPLRTLVDESVLIQAEVSIGSGERGTAIILRTLDLMRALGDVEVVSLSDQVS